MPDAKKGAPPAATPATEPPKKKSPLILIIVLVVVGLLLAGGISFFVTTRIMADNGNQGESAHHDPGVFVKLGDAKDGILVNVGGQKSGKFLKTTIILEMNPGMKANVQEGQLQPMAETKILDATIQFLRSVNLDEYDASKEPALKKQLKDKLNDLLGQGSVYDVYITSFMLQ